MRIYTVTQDEIGDGEAPSVGLYASLRDCKAALEEFGGYPSELEHDGTVESSCLALWQPGLPFGPEDPPDMSEVTCLKCRIEEWDGTGQFWLFNPDRIGHGDLRVVAEAHELTITL